MSISKNLTRLMSEKGINPHRLARETGVKQPTIFRILQGHSESPRDSTLRPLAEYFGVPLESLRYADEKKVSEQKGLYVGAVVLQKQQKYQGRVPIISYVQAGDFCEAIDNFEPGDAEEWLPFRPPNASDQTYALRVEGHSNSPRIQPGEIVIVDPAANHDPGKFVVAKQTANNNATLKQLAYESGEYYLKAANPDWPERIIKMDEEWHICGVVIGKYDPM